jgi:SAM-dependent methyltransferase
MSRLEDLDYLRSRQYATGGNLEARIGFHDRFSTNPVPWHRWMFEQLNAAEDAHILEVGCGVGRLWADNLDRVPPGWRITLSDLSPGMLEEARAVFEQAQRRVDGRVADVAHLPLADAGFDVAIANHMLYHVRDRAEAIAELRRVLRPGGVLYAATNGATHLQEIGGLIARHQPDALPYPHGSGVFGLENGAEQLHACFDRVDLIAYPDSAVVTDPAAVVAFIASSAEAYGVGEHALQGIRAEVTERIARDGALTVTKETGLFVCS